MEYTKLVDFKKWCPTCENANTPEAEDPCNECLARGANEATTKPVCYKEKVK